MDDNEKYFMGPCPFCGHMRGLWLRSEHRQLSVHCDECSADGPKVRHEWRDSEVEECIKPAIKKWNERASSTRMAAATHKWINAVGDEASRRVGEAYTWLRTI